MDTAVIGVAFRFPGAADGEGFWENLDARRSSVTEIPQARWDWRPLWGDPKLEPNKSFSKWGGFIDDVDAFDHEFFGLLPKVVRNMDPQQRIMLELAWSSLEDAGIPPASLRGRPVGVFVGVTHHDYKELLAGARVEIGPYHYTGTATVVVPNRISHALGLRGPSIPIDTACSSALNAIHTAIQSLETGECELALAGGVSLILNPARHISVSKMGTLSPTGSCKTLDERADGYVRGEGAGFFVLKPLDKALADGDRIHGVIKGSAINHCGEAHTLTYPSAEAQAAVIVAAHERAGVPVDSVNFVELHGTGTAKGDPIEFEGLSRAFAQLAERQGIALSPGFCGLSSAKTNLGHLEAAAGMAGVAKVLLAFRHRRLPGFHDFRTLNPRVSIDGTAFRILAQTVPWQPARDGMPLRAGISAFGFGGTNAHLILEEPPAVAQRKGSRRSPAKAEPCLVVLSARTADALQRRREDLARWLDDDAGEHTLREISRALLLGRDHMPFRFACVVDSLDALRDALRADAPSHAPAADTEALAAMRVEAEALLADARKRNKAQALQRLRRLETLYLGAGLAIGDAPWRRLFDDAPARRPPLPTYPFARHRFWLPETRLDDPALDGARTGATKTIETPASLVDSLYAPHWRTEATTAAAGIPAQVVLIGDAEGLDRLEPRLRASPRFAGTRFERIEVAADAGLATGDGSTARLVHPDAPERHADAVAALAANGVPLDRIVLVPPRVPADDVAARVSFSARHLFALVKAMMRGTRSARFVQLAPPGESAVEYAALDGFFKTLRIEKPSYSGRVVLGAWDAALDPRLAEIVADELADTREASCIRHRVDGTREAFGFTPVAPTAPAAVGSCGFREGGTYLITGGLGGIGRVVAQHLCTHHRAHVYLTGRAPASEAQRETMAALSAGGGQVSYVACDPSDRGSVRDAIAAIRAQGRRLNGVLHSAGMIQDNFILRKTPEEFARVIAPKTLGTVHLDLETRDEPLDFFALFSSIAGVMGNVGQADYAYGNAFEDAYAHWREAQRANGECRGRSVSINWPFWRNGGMRMGEAEIAAVRRSFGIVPLEDAAGIDALEFALGRAGSQLIVMPGDAARVRESMGVTMPAAAPVAAPGPALAAAPAAAPATDPAAVASVDLEAVHAHLAKFIADELNMSAEFEPDKSFKDYGVDSVVMIELIAALEKLFGTLPKTLFFEYPTLNELSGYFHEQHGRTTYATLLRPARAAITAGPSASMPPASSPLRAPAAAVATGPARHGGRAVNDEPIAVIGLAGRYPQADTLDAFWQNLSQGRDCIEEIPEDRPDLAAQFRFRPGEPARAHAYAKWGGFLRDVDRFDAVFFNISPKEAQDLDPNERLFLEIVAHAIEDAGYTPPTLAAGYAYRENPVGVYVGVMWGDYQLHGVDRARDAWVTPHAGYWAVANRVSYQFNFSGPSMAVDTACSSSLTAIHLACQALRCGDIEAAVAGAVNLSLHPNKYNLLADMHMLAVDGRCRAFGADGSGYVPGEGVGAAILKPLSKALRDGDHVYGLIRGTAINHGGKASGFTVPNPNRQAALIREALDVSAVDPRHVSYVEAHGTGTSLGDPIEIAGLTKAYEQNEVQYCAIGSAKSNIGHLEGAAGIAGLTKVLLQMRHRQLAPSIHADTLNPYIDFARSPFRVQRSLQPWHRPTVVRDGVVTELPRLAGLSSFGAGGANGHVIIEEYVDDVRADALADAPALFVLSARREPVLRTMASRLAQRLEAEPGLGMRDVAYTLQVGRVAHEFRVAILADTREALLHALHAFADRGELPARAWSGHRDDGRRDAAVAARLSAALPQVPQWLDTGDLASLASAWTVGAAIDWSRLHAQASRRRVPLPGYPFQRQRYWVDTAPPLEASGVLHPLVDANVSTLDEQAYSKVFRPDEFFLRDHRLGDNRVLPGVVYLETALQAARLAAPGLRVKALCDVQWIRPVVLDADPLRMRIVLAPERDAVAFELHAADDPARAPYAHGSVVLDEAAGPGPADAADAPERHDLQAIMQRCERFERAQVDAVFAAMGFTFGSSFQVYDALYCNADEALGCLRLPPIPGVDHGDFVLHPALLDGSTRACLGIGGLLSAEKVVHVPVKLGRVEIHGRLGDRAHAYARRATGVAVGPGQQAFDVALCDDDGRVCIRLVHLIGQAAPQLTLAMGRAQAGARPPLPASRTPAAAVPMAAVPASATAPAAHGSDQPVDRAIALLTQLLADVTRLPASEIDPRAPLENYGIDSLMIATLNRDLDARFGAVPKTLFFEYRELAGVAGYLAEQHADALRAVATAPAVAMAPAPAPAPSHAPAAEAVAAGTDDVHAGVNDFLKGIVAETTGLPMSEIDPQAPMENYGIDSMMIVKLTGRIEQAFGPVSKTLFFEYQELDGLARHLAETAPDAARAVAASKVAAAPVVAGSVVAAMDPSATAITRAPARPVPAPAAPAVDAPMAWPPAPPRESPSARTDRRFGRFGHRRGDRDGQAIAIIGLAGHYPHAEDLATFWRNLESGRDCIGEIPPSRWDHTRIFHPDRNHKGTAYGKWGGFMDDIDRFDARFFNISAREAVLMDPQERLFLQTAWECVEDACHTRQSLKGLPVGVFVGVAWQYYAQFEVSDAQLQSGRPSTPLASIANRVSYFMNFSGPSMVLDTMCSSSLTAIHLACRAIENGDCALAIAGGVNVMAHSNKYLQLSAGQFLSTDGRCRAFGTGGDGYVPGEGVGAVLLKPLERALEDGDHVYGVIRGTALNHGGKTNGFTVPSQGAQTEVIGKALERAGWDPGSIGYLEAHGTGTSLGDPIEIAGLARAFSQAASAGSHAPPAPQSCRIGSVKSGIGHLESAAGIAGLTRILLQFRHGTIAPSLHSATLNPAIDFERTPFRVPQQAEPWPATGGRRRAGISSFGAGGSNAHCLVEDHPAPTPIADAGPSLFLLSADSEERLARYVDRVIAFLEGGGHPDTGLDLASLAYSSQVGREAMDERLAVVASDVGELLAALRGHRRGEATGERVVRGAARKSGEKLEAIVDEAEKDGLIRKLIAGGRLAQLARAWVSLLDIDWARHAEALHAASGRARPPRRMPFPTMPFLTQRYWVDEKAATGSTAVDALHPLLDRNVSDLSVQAYHKRFDGHEFYLRDHVIDTGRPRRILPGAAYLEMARVAGDLACAAAGLRVAGIRRLMWLQPFEIDEREDGLTVRLRNDEDALRFDMVRDTDGVVCVEGELALCEADAPTEAQHIDLAGLLASAEPLSTDTTAIYAGLRRMGFRFGPSFQVTQARYRTGDGVLSRLQLPGHLRAGLDAYGLHPALLDAVLRSGLAVLGVPGEELTTPIVPFALASMDYVHPLPETCFVHAVACRDAGADAHAGSTVPDPQSALFKCDLVVADADGRVLLRLDGIAGRAMTRPGAHRALQYFAPAWTAQPLVHGTPDRTPRTLLAIADDDHALDAIAGSAPPDWQVIRVTLACGDGDGDRDAAAGHDRFDPDHADSAERLFAALQERGVRPDRIVLWQGGTMPPALAADHASPAALHRGMRAVRRLFIASEAANPGAAVRMLYVYADAGVPQPQHEAVSGFARSLLTVNHRFELSTFRCEPGDPLRTAEAAMAELAAEGGFGANEIAWHDGRRHRRSLHALDAAGVGASAEAGAGRADDAGDRLPLRERGAYLITGGGGKLGLVVARWMAERCRARLLLSGRSTRPSPELAQAMAAMRATGADVEYRSADSADRTSIDALAAYAERRFGALHGVVHCAGIASDRSVLALDDDAFDAILAPKVEGLIALDQATAHMRLDFFALFSSVSAVIGDLGSCAYAAGNRFMDGFAPWREHLRAQGLRSGMTFSIDWPLWATGGMDIAGADASVFGFSGMQALTEREGLDAFGQVLRGDRSNVLVAVGDPDRIARTLRLPAAHAEAATAHPPATAPTRRTQTSSTPIAAMATTPAAPVADDPVANDLVARAEGYVKQRVAIVTRTTADAIDARATFEQCGMDSVLMLELHAALRADIAELPKTALFEYDSAGALARHLVAHHGPRLAELLGAPATSASATSAPATSTASLRHAPAIAAAPAQARPAAAATRHPPSVRAFARSALPPGATAPDEGIAIVGIAGEFPDAPDLSRFWQHLREGRDCLIRIPDDRGFASSLGRQRSRSGKPISDKGGFIADVDLFDPALFRMSQAEADKADPQLRVLLRTAWRAVEDAAYTPQALAASRVGVFVGTMNDDFTRIAAELQMRSADFLGPGSVSSELSNRLSFLMDFCGPSVTVSTACSASLTALHLARRSILAGDCEVALVGGINLSLHKSKYQLLHEMNVLSPDGQERTFDERANGLVPSEGAAAVLLKPLRRALADGDHVYGVIRGSRIGHSGTGAGQFMPNLRVMEDTAAECIREAGIHAEELTYLETHGTGTELGDPIELKALANALRRGTEAVGHCAIGSKANIGHMEAASGLGSLIKVLLSMRHGEVAPCAKLDRINSSFDHARSPFRFPTAVAPWPRNARGTRVAGINSFGMGGSNAFVVVESIDTARNDATAAGEPVLFVLSARSEDGLRRYALAVADAVRARTDDDLSPAALADLAYTSQVGRIGFRHRLAVVARDAEALIAGLIAGADGASRPRDGVYRGDVESPAAADTHRLLSGDAGAHFVETLIGTRQWNGLADLWVRGVAVDWAALHRGQARRRCAFPGVPFEWVRCDLRHQMVALPGAAMPIEVETEAAIDGMAIATDAGDDAGVIASGWCRLATLATAGDDAEVDDDGARRYWTEHLGDAAETAVEVGHSLTAGSEGRALEHDAPGELYTVSEVIDTELVRTLQAFGARHGIAVETMVAAAWAVLVNRYTKAKYSQFGVLGTGVDGEARLLPVRVRTVGRQKILAWLTELQATLLGGHRGARSSLATIGEWVGRTSLFDSVVAFDGGASSMGDAGEPRIELVAMAEDDALELSLIYRAATPGYISAGVLLQQITVLLEGIAGNPDRMPSALAMRTRDEGRERLWKTMEAMLE